MYYKISQSEAAQLLISNDDEQNKDVYFMYDGRACRAVDYIWVFGSNNSYTNGRIFKLETFYRKNKELLDLTNIM